MSRRWVTRLAPWAVVVVLSGLLGLHPSPAGASAPAAPATTAAPVTTAAPAVPATAAPAAATPAAPAPTDVPGLPSVPTTITDGVPAQTLLDRAVALSAIGPTSAPVQTQLSQAAAKLDADTVTAAQADAAAAKASRAEAVARASAATASRDYRGLAAALEAATIRLYMNGPVGLPSLPSRDVDELLYATDYEQTALTPQGILDRRHLDVGTKEAALARAEREADVARTDVARAATELSAAAREKQQLEAQLSSLSTGTAVAVDAEHQALATQAGAELTSATSLEFTPSAPIPAPLATTDVALEWAFSELGKEYVWGGTGPDTFDCSGLTQFVWAQAGVSIPRVAADQDAWTIPVPLSQLSPGDLVFYGTTDIHHVGIYIGSGLMINAPHTGTVVQVSSIWWSDLSGFGRVHAAGVPVPTHELPSASAPASPAVVPTAGPVPSQATPPPGSTALGSTVPSAPSAAPTTPAASGSAPAASPGNAAPAPSGSPPSGSAPPVTPAPGASTTDRGGATTTTTAPPACPSTSTTTTTVEGTAGSGTTTSTEETTTTSTTTTTTTGGGTTTTTTTTIPAPCATASTSTTSTSTSTSSTTSTGGGS
jgi:peptidoglycan DL-endopeptidase CwlO